MQCAPWIMQAPLSRSGLFNVLTLEGDDDPLPDGSDTPVDELKDEEKTSGPSDVPKDASVPFETVNDDGPLCTGPGPSKTGCVGREIHVMAEATAVARFADMDRSNMICYRCGEVGHVRYQCLTYKVRLCWHNDSPSGCKDPNCTFAHGIQELRTPWMQRCVRVVKQNGRLISVGCLSTDHTFRKCPMNKGLLIF